MASDTVGVAIRRLPSELMMHVNVRLTKQLKVRMWLGKHLIIMAARVMGCGIRFDEKEETAEDKGCDTRMNDA